MNNKKSNQKGAPGQEYEPKIPKKSQISAGCFLLIALIILLMYYLFVYTNLDAFLITVIIALVGIVVNLFTNTFTYILALIQSIPYIGPMIANIITWPIFVTLNVVAYFVSLLVIRFRGVSMVKDARIITTIFLLGLLLGFILGRIF